jgi:hypothetical protein
MAGSTVMVAVYDISSGVQVPVVTEHHWIDAPEVESVMVVVCGIA